VRWWNRFKENKAQILKTKTMINEFNTKLTDIDATLAKGNSVMSTVNNIWPTFSAELPEIQTEANYVKEKYDTLYTYIKENPTKALTTVQNMEIATNTIIKSLKYLDAILTTLYDVTGDTNLKPIIDQIELDITKANKVLGILQEIEADLKAGNDPSSKLNKLKTSIDQMDSAINTLANNKENINQIINEASAKIEFS
jgi:putative membrane protein